MSGDSGADWPSKGVGEGQGALRGTFSLMRRFSILSLMTILVAGTGMAAFLTHLVTGHILIRDAKLGCEITERNVPTEYAFSTIDTAALAWSPRVLDRSVRHLRTLSDVVGIDLSSLDRTMTSSSGMCLSGQRLG